MRIHRPVRLLALLIAPVVGLGLAGCNSDGELTYASVYEGLFGDELPPTPTQAVAMMFNRDDADQRRKGIGWIAASPFGGDEEYLASYRLFVNDPDASVRAAAAQAMGFHGTVDDALLLLVLLKDDDAFVRWQAADALRKIHNPDTVTALVDRLDPEAEEDADTRASAAQALGQYADPVVFARLATALEDRSFTVVVASHRSLVLLTGHDAGLDPRDWSDWSSRTVNPFANQQPYTYAPYQPTRGWFDEYVTFWNNQDKQPETPRGLSRAEP